MTGFPVSHATQRSEAAPRAAPSLGAPHEGGGIRWRERPPFFGRWCGTEWVTGIPPTNTHSSEGRSLHQ